MESTVLNQKEALTLLIDEKLDLIRQLEIEVNELKNKLLILDQKQDDLKDYQEPLYVFYSDECSNESQASN